METIWITNVKNTPLSPIWLAVTKTGLAAVEIGLNRDDLNARLKRLEYEVILDDDTHTEEASQQISDYLAGKRKRFDLPIDWSRMRPFQEQVLRLTLAIPYGQVATYQEIASRAGKPEAARAVGRAEATNPIPLVIPCHRVVGKDGKLHGYGAPGGVETKAWLLRLEKGV